VYPVSLGGAETVACCFRCNQDKADRTLPDWLSWLIENGDPRGPVVQRFLEHHPKARHFGLELDARIVAPIVALSMFGSADPTYLTAAKKRQTRSSVTHKIINELRKAGRLSTDGKRSESAA
jgi:hypothetical protein